MPAPPPESDPAIVSTRLGLGTGIVVGPSVSRSARWPRSAAAPGYPRRARRRAARRRSGGRLGAPAATPASAAVAQAQHARQQRDGTSWPPEAGQLDRQLDALTGDGLRRGELAQAMGAMDTAEA